MDASLVVLCIVPVCRATSWIVPLLHCSRALLTQPHPRSCTPFPLNSHARFISSAVRFSVLSCCSHGSRIAPLQCPVSARSVPVPYCLNCPRLSPRRRPLTPLSAASLLCTRARRRGLDLSWFHSFDPECVSVSVLVRAMIWAGSVRVLHRRSSTAFCACSPSLQVLPDAWPLRLW